MRTGLQVQSCKFKVKNTCLQTLNLQLGTCNLSLITYHSLNSFNDARRGSAFDEGEREDSAAGALDLFAAVYLVESVVAAFDEYVRQDFRDERARRLFVEDRDEVDRFQGGEDFGALRFAHDGAVRAFERAHRAVAVYRDEQRVAEAASVREVTHVAYVQDVEAPVR